MACSVHRNALYFRYSCIIVSPIEPPKIAMDIGYLNFDVVTYPVVGSATMSLLLELVPVCSKILR